MTGADEAVAIFEAEDGVLLFGSAEALAAIDAEPGVVSKPISARNVARVGAHAGSAASALMTHSGRWVKLTSQSAKDLKLASKVSGSVSDLGILRSGGQFSKHLRFENLGKAAALSPAGPAVLGAMATQYALEAALDDITAYLETIDRKLDKLLQQHKTRTLGQLGGVTLAIDEAAAIYAETGTVSAVTWSKVQATSLALKSMQAEAVEQLHVLSDSVTETAGDVDKAAAALEEAKEDAAFWLGVLARAIALQDRQYVLELARVADEDELQLDSHRQGILVARAERVRRIEAGLESMATAVAEAASLSNAGKVTNPINAPRVARRSAHINTAILTFADHADLTVQGQDLGGPTSWRQAARGLFGEASTAVGTAGASVADRARAVGQTVEERRDDRVLRRAQKIAQKRRRRD